MEATDAGGGGAPGGPAAGGGGGHAGGAATQAGAAGGRAVRAEAVAGVSALALAALGLGHHWGHGAGPGGRGEPSWAAACGALPPSASQAAGLAPPPGRPCAGPGPCPGPAGGAARWPPGQAAPAWPPTTAAFDRASAFAPALAAAVGAGGLGGLAPALALLPRPWWLASDAETLAVGANLLSLARGEELLRWVLGRPC